MQLRWYAQTPTRRTRQIAADVLAGMALLLCYWLGTSVHDLTAELAGPGQTLESAGGDLAGRMSDAGSAASEVPFVGDRLQDALEQGGDAGRTIENAGVQQQEVVGTLATALGWVTGGTPALLVLASWLPVRLRFAWCAGQASSLLESGAGMDVLAIRALARQPISVLARLPQDPAAGWRVGDPQAIESLAALELGRLGLRVGHGPRTSST